MDAESRCEEWEEKMVEYIEKQAALDAILREPPDAHYPSWYAERIKALPAADVIPRPHWIPADEELPPEGIDVLCWYEYFRYGSYNRMYQTVGLGYQFGGDWNREVAQGRLAKVLAWMPLPEPLEIDGGEDDG